MLRPLVAQRLCQLAHTALARRVRGDRDAALEREEGGDVDDGAPAVEGEVSGLGEHVGADIAAESEDGGEVDLEDGGPVVVGELVGGMALLDAAAVEEDVDSVAVCEDGGHERGDGRGGGEVGGVDCGGTAEGFDGGFGGLVACIALERVRGWRR